MHKSKYELIMKKALYLITLSLLFSCGTSTTIPQRTKEEAKKENTLNLDISSYPKDETIKEFEPPQYPTGKRGLLKFIGKTTNYPMSAADKGMQGVALVKFLVSKEGKIENIKIKKSTGYSILDKEALLTISKLEKLIPATDSDGKNIDCYMEIPITWRLDPVIHKYKLQ